MKAQVTPNNAKALSVLWGPLDEYVLTGHEDGSIIKWDMRTGKQVGNIPSPSFAISVVQYFIILLEISWKQLIVP